jgi:hypothetical protein
LAGRTPPEAVLAFLEPLKEVVGCVTDAGFVARGRRPHIPYTATFQTGGAAKLSRPDGQRPIILRLAHEYIVREAEGEIGPWKVSTRGWIYDIADADGTPIVAFHWHPDRGRATWPHIHAYGDHPSVYLDKLHPPTGRVSIEAVVRFLINDLDVVPLKEDWEQILARREAAFIAWRTWH